MKKLVMAAIAVASLCLSNAASAAEVVITTGQQGLTYNAVYGVNLASAMSEYGYSSTVIPSKGSLDNLDKVASGTARSVSPRLMLSSSGAVGTATKRRRWTSSANWLMNAFLSR
jgi:hypothetical protein